MFLFIPRSLCALKRVAAKADHPRFATTQGIRIALACGMDRAEAIDGRRAVVVQGMVPTEESPWPAFKELPDDAFEAIILPKDLERACKVGEDFFQSKFGLVGIATMGNNICLGLGADVVTPRIVEGKFPPIDQVIPRKKPLFTFCVDPKILDDTLLAIADMLHDENRSVQCFFYGNGQPLGFCARNNDNGTMIDALVVPLAPSKADAKPAPQDAGARVASLKRMARVRGSFDVRWSYFAMNTPQVLQTISAKLFVPEQAKATVQSNEMLEEIRDGLRLTFKELVDALLRD